MDHTGNATVFRLCPEFIPNSGYKEDSFLTKEEMEAVLERVYKKA